MAKFASASRQSASVMKAMQGDALPSVGTVRNYEQALTSVGEYAKETLSISLRELTPEQAVNYLEQRAEQVSQSTLNMERQAIQAMMIHVTNKLEEDEKLTVVKSELRTIKESRAYTQEQVEAVANSQNEKNSLSTLIAYNAGLRAHELLTLQRLEERLPDERPAHDCKFKGRENSVRYTVKGKGGLVREVAIRTDLAKKLEKHRLEKFKSVVDRNVNYQTRYEIPGGHKWTSSFSAASKRAIGWSAGAHGVRHSYAQERMHELQSSGLKRIDALEITSQEMGHFRKEITEVYLR